ncbi:MAG: choice-of-anchor R domain-containing protein [Bryobacteraceae bacterium]
MGHAVYRPIRHDNQFTGFQVPFETNGSPTIVDFSVMSDANNMPGTPLETMTIPVQSSTASILSGTSTLHPILSGGTQYWLAASISSSALNTQAKWNTPQNVLFNPPTGLIADRQIPVFNWSAMPGVQAAYEIDGAPIGAAVPEPSSAVLLLLGCVAAVCVRIRTLGQMGNRKCL